MISCSKCKKATLPVSDGGCIRTGGVVDIGCEYGEPRINTNYDRLISKSPEELAFELACSGCPKEHFMKDNELVACPAEREPSKADCVRCWLGYLKQPVEEEAGE